jgi:hypothetical protein
MLEKQTDRRSFVVFVDTNLRSGQDRLRPAGR